MSQVYGSFLDPHRRLKEPLGVKGNKQNVIVPNNPSAIDSDQILTVKFPDLGAGDVIVPGSARLTFKIGLDSTTDANRTVVQNLGRAVVKKISIKLEGQEVFSLHNADIFLIYSDLWLTANERADLALQGIESADALKHRVGAGDAKGGNKPEAVSFAYGNRFSIPLDFELLSAHSPYFQGALKDRLSYELTFNEYSRVILSTDVAAKYSVSDISLEFDIVSNPDLARQIEQQYTKLAIYYERVIHHSRHLKSRADTIWNFSFSATARSLKGILLLCENEEPYNRQTEKFINPKIKKVQCSIEGSPNQIYASGLKPYQHFDEIRKLFGGGGRHRHPTADLVCKDLHLHNVRLDDYLTTKYGLWLDLRSTEDNQLHGSGRPVNDSINIQIEKEKESDKPLNVYLFLIYDAQLNIEGNRLKNIVY